jgi:hypothetical protein
MSTIATVIARSDSDEAIQRSCCGATGLLRYARNDGPEALVMERMSRGVLDAPACAGHDGSG